MIDRIVDGQSALIAYSDIFSYVATAFVLSLPLLLLLGGARARPRRKPPRRAH